MPASATLLAPEKASAFGLAIRKKWLAGIRERPGNTVAAATMMCGTTALMIISSKAETPIAVRPNWARRRRPRSSGVSRYIHALLAKLIETACDQSEPQVKRAKRFRLGLPRSARAQSPRRAA